MLDASLRGVQACWRIGAVSARLKEEEKALTRQKDQREDLNCHKANGVCGA